MKKSTLNAILQKYSISYTDIHEMQSGYRNESYPISLSNGSMANLLIYKNETGMLERIKRADAVSNYLYSKSFPARYNLDGRVIRLASRDGKVVKYGVLYGYMPGRTIPWEAYTRQILKLIGRTMSDMHASLEAVTLLRLCTRMVRLTLDTIVRKPLALFQTRQPILLQ